MTKSTHSLADVYDLSITRLFLTGPQAILRMVLMQSERDRKAGLDTAGYVSGYRRSGASTRRCGRRRSSSTARTCASSRA
jgi:indolepyruvate ferredoxin oxidoreductase